MKHLLVIASLALLAACSHQTRPTPPSPPVPPPPIEVAPVPAGAVIGGAGQFVVNAVVNTSPSIGVTLNADGTVAGPLTAGSPSWLAPTTAHVGGSLYYRVAVVTVLSNTVTTAVPYILTAGGPNAPIPTGVLTLGRGGGAALSLQLARNAGQATAVFKFEIYADAAGATKVGEYNAHVTLNVN